MGGDELSDCAVAGTVVSPIAAAIQKTATRNLIFRYLQLSGPAGQHGQPILHTDASVRAGPTQLSKMPVLQEPRSMHIEQVSPRFHCGLTIGTRFGNLNYACASLCHPG